MKLVCQPLTARHKGHQYFKYRIDFTGQVVHFIPRFVECMHWSTDTWGKSMPLSLYDRAEFLEFTQLCNPLWAWCDQKELHIYLKGDDELNMFKLNWIVE